MTGGTINLSQKLWAKSKAVALMVGLDKNQLKFVEENTTGQIRDSAVWDGIGKPIYSPGHHSRISCCVEIISRLPWTRLLELGPMAAPVIRLYNLWLNGENVLFDALVAGVMATRERRRQGETVALDITNGACRYYRDNDIFDHVVRGTWDNLPFREESFDLTLWTEGPEHAIDPKEVMGEVAKLSRRWVVTSAPDWPPEKAFDHYHAITMEELKAMVADHFKVVEAHIIPPYVWQIVVGEKAKNQK